MVILSFSNWFSQCNWTTGDHDHENVKRDKHKISDLQDLFDLYQGWWVPGSVAQAWADWIHENLNKKSRDVRTEGTYSIEVVLGWSEFRITIVVLLPFLLSLGIGIGLNKVDWSDIPTIQMAWGIATYVVTTAACKFPC